MSDLSPSTKIHSIDRLDISATPVKEFSIDLPCTGTGEDLPYFQLAGWVVGEDQRVLGLQIMHHDFVLKRIAAGLARPDVAQHLAGHPYAADSGFRTDIGVVALPHEFEVTIRAVLPGDTDEDSARRRVPLAIVKGEHNALSSDYTPQRIPLMITALGRSGTTWLMHLLSQHPAISTFNQYPYEVRAGVYWMHMLNVLSSPGNHAQSTSPDGFETDLFNIGHCPYFHPSYLQDVDFGNDLARYFGRDYTRRLATFCKKSIDRFYDLFDRQSGNYTLYFMEKGIGGQIPYLFRNVYASAKEIVLVRDCRDMYCSLHAFNEKRGYAGFGRERVVSNEEWIANLRKAYGRIIDGWRLRRDEVCLIRYEDLITQPQESLSRILDYLDIDRAEADLETMLTQASQDTPELQGHRTSSDPRDSIGRWKRDMDPDTVKHFDTVFGNLLHEVGYSS